MSETSSQLRNAIHACRYDDHISLSAWTHRTGDPTGLGVSLLLTEADAVSVINALRDALASEPHKGAKNP